MNLRKRNKLECPASKFLRVNRRRAGGPACLFSLSFETNILTTLSIIDIWESTLRKKKEQIAKSAKRRR
jgi:hypothetical protein